MNKDEVLFTEEDLRNIDQLVKYSGWNQYKRSLKAYQQRLDEKLHHQIKQNKLDDARITQTKIDVIEKQLEIFNNDINRSIQNSNTGR